MIKKLVPLIILFIILIFNIIPAHAATKAGSYYVTTASLNFRKGPGTSYSKLLVLAKGTKVKILECSSNCNWSKIYYSKKYGWVSNSYLTLWKSNYRKYLIIVNSNYNKISTYKNGILIKSDSCCTGKPSTPTPCGKTTIINHIQNPSYTSPETGTYYPGGSPDNPLGTYWNGLGWKGYGIHGTNNLDSLGHNLSHGCIRTRDPEWYAENIPIGTTVLVSAKAVSNTKVASWYSIGIFK